MIVLGLDGAAFELIDPWIKEGKLPTIKHIKENGCWADLQSCLPPVTAPNWKCYSTGMNPGKLGIFYWELIDFKNQKVILPNFFGFEEFWYILNRKGISTGISGMPLTQVYEPREGYFIAGAPTANDFHFASPESLEKLLKAAGFKPGFDHSIRVEPEKAKPEILEKITRELINGMDESLLGKVAFKQITTYYLNELHHYLWDSQETKEAWSHVDITLKELLTRNEDILVMSDHGSNKIEKVFNINCWLEKKGYLKLKLNTFTGMRRLGLTKELGARILGDKLIPLAKRVLPRKLYDTVPLEEGNISGKGKEECIDWERSWAVASDQGPVYVKNNDSKVIEEIEYELSKVEDVVSKVYHREEIYNGPYLNIAPNLIIDQKPHIHICSGLGLSDIYSKAGTKWLGENKKYGMFMGIGPRIKAKGKLENIKILDLAPTILSYYGIDKPSYMDGRVLEELL